MKKVILIIAEILLCLVVITAVRVILGITIPTHREVIHFVTAFLAALTGPVIVKLNTPKK